MKSYIISLLSLVFLTSCGGETFITKSTRKLVGGADAQLIGSFFEGKTPGGGYHVEDQLPNAYGTELACRKYNLANKVTVELTENDDGSRDWFWRPIFVEFKDLKTVGNGYFSRETEEPFGGVTRRGTYYGQFDETQDPPLFWVRAAEAYSIPQGTCYLYYTLIAQLVEVP